MARSEAQKATYRKWSQANPEKQHAWAVKWRAKNKEKHGTYNRAWNREHKAGWPPDVWDAACASQQGKCFICGADVKLVGDHDHLTGQPRKPICAPCNGNVDRIEWHEACIEYVRMHRG